MENFENTPQVTTTLTEERETEIKNYLLETARWGKFIAIVGYVGIALIAIAAIVVMLVMSASSSITGSDFPSVLLGVLYLAIAVVYYFPVNYLYKFSTLMREGLETDDKLSITSGFENLKSLFKFIGIFTIVILSIYALLLVIVLPLTLLAS